jgi:hypothetical protein
MALGCVGLFRDVLHRGEGMAAITKVPNRE